MKGFMETRKIDFEIPYNGELERDFLGSVLIGGYHQARDLGVTSDWFYDPRNIEVWNACGQVDAEGAQVNQVTVTTKARRQALYIDDLCEKGSTYSNVSYFITDLANVYIRRRAFIGHYDALIACVECKDASELQKRLEETLFDVTDGIVKDKDQKEAMKAFIALLESANPKGVPNRGGKTGMPALDNMLRGLKEGSMNTLAARPGRGKTSFALQVAIETAKRKEQVAFYSYEMPYNQIVTKAVSYLSGVDVDDYLQNGANEGTLSKIVKATKEFYSLPIHIEDDPGLTINNMTSQIRRMSKERDLKLVVVDYLQLIGSGRMIDNRVNEVSWVSRELKKAFMKTGVPGLVLAQMNRSIEGREGKPRLSDLRESGSIEQDSDTVMFLHDDPENDKDDSTCLVLKKNRHGKTGNVYMEWIKPLGRFTPVENKNEEVTDNPLF